MTGQAVEILRPPRRKQNLPGACSIVATCAAMFAVVAGTVPSFAAGSPRPHGPLVTIHEDDFQGISCSPTKGCLAAGSWYSKKPYALGETRSHGSSAWVIHDPAPIAGATGTAFGAIGTGESVNCVSSPAAICMGVGNYNNSAGQHNFAAVWNWSTWKIVNPPNPSISSSLDAVTCRSSVFCIAVGQWFNIATNKLELESQIWNGRSWTLKPVPPLPAGATSPSLDGISCSSTAYCMAVGDYDLGTSGSQPVLSEVWNGTSWTMHLPPNPAGASGSALIGVSCVSAAFCNAVGEALPKKGPLESLGELWTGKTWTIKSTPASKQTVGSVLYDVSCLSTTFCLSVGTLAAEWNGSSWTDKPFPQPAGSIETNAATISCLSPSNCTAAGDESTSLSNSLTVVMDWNGKSLKLQKAQNP